MAGSRSSTIITKLRKAAHVIGEASIGGGEVANGIAVLPAAVVAGAEKASIASSSLPGVGDVARIFNAVPTLGMFLGVLKMLNGIRGFVIAGTTPYLDTEWLTITKKNSKKKGTQPARSETTKATTSDHGSISMGSGDEEDEETLESPGAVLKRTRNEIGIEALLEFMSGGALFGLCYRAYQVAHTSTTSLLPSLALASMGFAVSSLIDLLRAARTLHKMYKNRNNLSEKELTSQKLATFQHLLKFAGWSALACSSALSTGPLLVIIGCALIGLSAVPQLWETLKLAGSGLSYAGTSLVDTGVFGQRWKHKYGTKSSAQNHQGLDTNPELEQQTNRATQMVRA